MAHYNYEQLQLLVNLLDSALFDIYIHIDKKSPLPQISSKNSAIYILEKRIDVRWGDVSQIECELTLFEASLANGPYEYYHLLSGIDLPIKNNEYIYNFFEKNKGKEFIGFLDESKFKYRVEQFHFFTRYYRSNNILVRMFMRIARPLTQKIVNSICKRKFHGKFKYGPNWASITNDFCKYLVDKKNKIINDYQYTLCADEVYKQTIAFNSKFKENIFNLNGRYDGCLRLIDWKRGGPYIWGG